MVARLRDQETSVTEMLRSASAADGAVRAEMQQMEARMEARQRSQETSTSEINRLANEGLSSLKLLVAAMQSELAANHQQAMERTGGALDEAATEAIFARVDRGFEVLNARIAGIERTVEEIRRHSAQFENNIAADLVDLEQNVKTQVTSIESARTAMSQTDDLVERVVEALESLQTAVLDQAEAGDRSSLAVN